MCLCGNGRASTMSLEDPPSELLPLIEVGVELAKPDCAWYLFVGSLTTDDETVGRGLATDQKGHNRMEGGNVRMCQAQHARASHNMQR